MSEARLSWFRSSGARQALAGAAVFGVLGAVIEVGLGDMLRRSYNPFQVVWWRYAVHLALVVVLWGFTRRQAIVRTTRPVFQLSRSLLMLTMPAAYVLALYAGVPADFIWSTFWTTPAAIMLVSWWWVGEKPSALWLGLAVAGALAAVMIYGDLWAGSAIGLFCAAAMQLSFVFYLVMTRALARERTEANLFYTAVAPFVGLALLMPLVWVSPDLHDAVVMTAIGVVGFVALYAVNFACRSGSATAVAPGLLAHVPAVFALTLVGQGVHMGSRAATGSVVLVVILVLAWLLANAPSSTGAVGRSHA